MNMDCELEEGLKLSLVGDCLTSLIWMARGDGLTVSLSAVMAGADGAGSLPRLPQLLLPRSLQKMILA
jgi:hypothetical protein